MEIDGPLLVSVIHDEQSMNRDLQVNFTQEFQSLPLNKRAAQFLDYVQSLRDELTKLTDDNDPTKQGMLTILQLAEELLPHIRNNEIPLEETINVTLESAVKVTNLLDSFSKH